MTLISNIDQLVEIDKEPELPPLHCGFPMLDEICEGFVPGELVVVSGVPKHGKSLLMKTFVNNFYKKGVLSLVLSYEEIPRTFYKAFPDRSQDILFFMDDDLQVADLDWMEERIVQAKEELGVSVVFLDNGQFMFETDTDRNVSHIVGKLAMRLKRIAIKHALVIFLIWHITKGEIKCEDDLTVHVLRDSSLVLASLDTLLFIYRSVKSDKFMVEEVYSSVKVACTRRSGAFQQVVPIKKGEYYFEEIGGY
jgi:replicative DNA helicase